MTFLRGGPPPGLFRSPAPENPLSGHGSGAGAFCLLAVQQAT
ncbi:hypothetical protein ACFPM0_21820 [Pseudonocardia sulfidoxydans]